VLLTAVIAVIAFLFGLRAGIAIGYRGARRELGRGRRELAQK
jgi:hypothetical protein